MGKRKLEPIVTEADILQMFHQILLLRAKSQGPCECTVHRRTGDIVDLCGPCSAGVALEEIRDYIADQYEEG